MEEVSREDRIKSLRMSGMTQEAAERFVDKMEAKQEIMKGWKPISEYNTDEYDWVLIKFFDGDYECVPCVAERRSDGKWYNSSDNVVPFEVRYFFDMQLIDEINKDI